MSTEEASLCMDTSIPGLTQYRRLKNKQSTSYTQKHAALNIPTTIMSQPLRMTSLMCVSR